MLVLTKDSANTIRVSLAELSTLATPVYLIEFISDMSLISTTCIAPDTSLYPARFNQFTITEQVAPNGLLAQILLEPVGFFTYNIYEQTSATNLSPSDPGVILLETGKARVLIDGDRESTAFTYYQNPTPAWAAWDVFASEGISPAPPSTDATYKNSDASFTQVIAPGVTYIAPDISFTDSDGSVSSVPANLDVVCTPGGVPSGILYARPVYSGYRTSFANYDEAWQKSNGTYDYIKTNAAIYSRLDLSNAAPFHFLSDNNAFGNNARFTDENGDYYTDPWDVNSKTDPNAFSGNYVIDHLTGLGWNRRGEASANWSASLSNANSLTLNTFSDWRVPTINEQFSVICYDVDALGPGSAKTGLEWYPFNKAFSQAYFTGTTNRINTAEAYVYWSSVIPTLSINLNRSAKASSLPYFICRNHYT